MHDGLGDCFATLAMTNKGPEGDSRAQTVRRRWPEVWDGLVGGSKWAMAGGGRSFGGL